MKFSVNAAEGREAENYLSLLYDLAQILTSTADVQRTRSIRYSCCLPNGCT